MIGQRRSGALTAQPAPAGSGVSSPQRVLPAIDMVGGLSVNQFRQYHALDDADFASWLQDVFVPAVVRGEKPGRAEWGLLRLGAQAAVNRAQGESDAVAAEDEKQAAKQAERKEPVVVSTPQPITPADIPQAPPAVIQALVEEMKAITPEAKVSPILQVGGGVGSDLLATAPESEQPAHPKMPDANPESGSQATSHQMLTGKHQGKFLKPEMSQSVDAFKKEYGMTELDWSEWLKTSLPYLRQLVASAKEPNTLNDPSWTPYIK